MIRDARVRSALAFFSALGISCGQALADVATIKVQSGTVKINHGQGFQTVTGEVRVSPGDLVMVEPSSMVTLVYDSNPCAIPLAAQQVTVVGPEAKCVAEAPAPDTPPPTEGGTTALSSTQMAIGIGALAGVAAIGIAASSSSKKSASP